MPSRERGSEPRPRAPVPIPAKHACRTALVDRDEPKIRPPGGLGIRNRKKFFALKLLRNLGL